MTKTSQRLASLDLLRGFDLFFLVGLESVMHALSGAVDSAGFHSFMWNFTHVDWQGFSPWDLVMPLFLFMSGVSIPFALSRYRGGVDRGRLIFRLFKRFALLWIFGMMCQGNLLSLDPDRIYLFSNTLQSIAVGYLVTALLFLFTTWRTQVGIVSALLLLFWALMEWVSIDGYGGGSYAPDSNLAEWVDRTVLGRFRDGATVQQGVVQFAPWYRYTWLLSSLGFVASVMSGAFAGQLLRSSSLTPVRKATVLALIGVGLVSAGWLWHLELPVIKKLWTGSMVLVSSGYCFLLMSLFYYVVDVRGHSRGLQWLRVYGMNSIVAYMLAQCISFSSVSHSLFHGLEQYVGAAWYQVILTVSSSLIIYLVLWRMYRQRIFLSV